MIGVFDSGSGGLTVLKEIHKLAPHLDVVYFGDFARLPYGEKRPEELGAFTTIAIEKLLQEGAENIVSACNSISASVAQPLISLLGEKRFGMVEMVGPTVRAVLKAYPEKTVGLVATPATVRSGIYQQAFVNARVRVEAVALPGLVDMIEEGDEGSEEMETLIYGAVKKLAQKHCDLLILGCTQYPLVQGVFEEATRQVGDGVVVYNPAASVAEETVMRFGKEGEGQLRFIISRDSDFFRKKVNEFFGEQEIEVL